MSKFKNMTGIAKIDQAIELTDKLLADGSELMGVVLRKNDWRFNSGTGAEVYLSLTANREALPVYVYTPWNRFTKAIGYFDGKAMYINSLKLPRMSVNDIVANLIHEWSHLCGFNHGFGRTANYPTAEKNLYSVPYFLSTNVFKYLDHEPVAKVLCKRSWRTLWIKKCYEVYDHAP